MMGTKPRHERAAEKRANQLRIINEIADRLQEVLSGYVDGDEDFYIPREQLLTSTLEPRLLRAEENRRLDAQLAQKRALLELCTRQIEEIRAFLSGTLP